MNNDNNDNVNILYNIANILYIYFALSIFEV